MYMLCYWPTYTHGASPRLWVHGPKNAFALIAHCPLFLWNVCWGALSPLIQLFFMTCNIHMATIIYMLLSKSLIWLSSFCIPTVMALFIWCFLHLVSRLTISLLYLHSTCISSYTVPFISVVHMYLLLCHLLYVYYHGCLCPYVLKHVENHRAGLFLFGYYFVVIFFVCKLTDLFW